MGLTKRHQLVSQMDLAILLAQYLTYNGNLQTVASRQLFSFCKIGGSSTEIK